MPTFCGIHCVTLTASDLAVSMPLNETLSGVVPVETLTGESAIRCIFRPAPAFTIDFAQQESPRVGPFDPNRCGLDHVGFACADQTAIVGWVDHLAPVRVALEFYVSARVTSAACHPGLAHRSAEVCARLV